MRNYGVPQFIDLIPDGPASVTPANGKPTMVEFLVQAPKAGVGADGWPIGLNYVLSADATFDQAAAGGTAVDWENWTIAIWDHFYSNTPLLGDMHVADTYTPNIAKHLIEFVSCGYKYGDGARSQIAAADGDSGLVHYTVLPFAHEAFDRPHHFGIWLGWLNASKVQGWVAAANAAGNLSTGAVIKAPTAVRGWIEYVVSDELVIPTINNWHRYQDAAAGKTTHTIAGIGTANGLQDVKDGSRIIGLYELTKANTPANPFGGATTADQYTSYILPQLSQDLTVNLDAYFNAARRAMGPSTGINTNGAGSATPSADFMRWPFVSYGAVPTNSTTFIHQNMNLAMFIPVRSPGENEMLTKCPKFYGDMKRTATFVAIPSTGNFEWVLNEARELGEGKKAEMIAKTGRPGKLERISTHKQNDNRTSMGPKQAGKGREASLPQIVRFG